MADITGITGASSSYSTSSTDDLTREIKTELGKDDFLQLLITQLTNQDPLEPLEDTEFIAQMAQFTSLEQMTNIADNMESLANFSMISAVSFIDRTVDYVDEATGSQAQAKVTGVQFEDGVVVLNLDNDTSIHLENVIGVA